jgi:hypothetical protein
VLKSFGAESLGQHPSSPPAWGSHLFKQRRRCDFRHASRAGENERWLLAPPRSRLRHRWAAGALAGGAALLAAKPVT